MTVHRCASCACSTCPPRNPAGVSARGEQTARVAARAPARQRSDAGPARGRTRPRPRCAPGCARRPQAAAGQSAAWRSSHRLRLATACVTASEQGPRAPPGRAPAAASPSVTVSRPRSRGDCARTWTPCAGRPRARKHGLAAWQGHRHAGGGGAKACTAAPGGIPGLCAQVRPFRRYAHLVQRLASSLTQLCSVRSPQGGPSFRASSTLPYIVTGLFRGGGPSAGASSVIEPQRGADCKERLQSDKRRCACSAKVCRCRASGSRLAPVVAAHSLALRLVWRDACQRRWSSICSSRGVWFRALARA